MPARYTQGLYMFLFNILLKKYWNETFSCFCFLLLVGFLFKALIKKILIWSVFTLLVASFFLLAAFSLKFAVFAVNLSGKWKLRMRPIRFNTWNFCWVYLLNTKNLECRHAIRRVYTCSFSIFWLKKYWIQTFSCCCFLLLVGFFFLKL